MKLLILSLVLCPLFSFAQLDSLPRNSENIVEYSAVVDVPGTEAKVLYSRAKLFIAKVFRSGKAVTQLDDDAALQIVAKGNMRVIIKAMGGNTEYGRMNFSVTIQAKDSKYRYFINEFEHEYETSKSNMSGGKIEREKPACGTLFMPKSYWARVKSYTDSRTKELIKEMDTYMRGETTQSTNDW